MAWDYPTNFSNGTKAVEGVGTLLAYGNYATNGIFAYGILVVIWLVVFLGGVMANSRKAFMAASFVTLMFSVYFMRIEMVSVPLVFFIGLIFIITAVLSSKEGTAAI